MRACSCCRSPARGRTRCGAASRTRTPLVVQEWVEIGLQEIAAHRTPPRAARAWRTSARRSTRRVARRRETTPDRGAAAEVLSFFFPTGRLLRRACRSGDGLPQARVGEVWSSARNGRVRRAWTGTGRRRPEPGRRRPVRQAARASFVETWRTWNLAGGFAAPPGPPPRSAGTVAVRQRSTTCRGHLRQRAIAPFWADGAGRSPRDHWNGSRSADRERGMPPRRATSVTLHAQPTRSSPVGREVQYWTASGDVDPAGLDPRGAVDRNAAVPVVPSGHSTTCRRRHGARALLPARARRARRDGRGGRRSRLYGGSTFRGQRIRARLQAGGPRGPERRVVAL